MNPEYHYTGTVNTLPKRSELPWPQILGWATNLLTWGQFQGTLVFLLPLKSCWQNMEASVRKSRGHFSPIPPPQLGWEIQVPPMVRGWGQCLPSAITAQSCLQPCPHSLSLGALWCLPAWCGGRGQSLQVLRAAGGEVVWAWGQGMQRLYLFKFTFSQLFLSLSPILASAGRFLSYLSLWLPSTPSVFPSRRTLRPSQVCLLGEGTLRPKRTGCGWISSLPLSPPCFLFSSSLPIPADRDLLCSLVWSQFNASVYLRQPP